MLFAAAAIAFGSCSRNDENESVTPEKVYSYSFNLSVAQTKAVLGTRAVEYEAGDKIGVFVGGATQSEGVVDVEKTPVVVEFKTDKALVAGETLYAYFPYAEANSSASPDAVKLTIPVSQNQKAGTYDAEAMPLVALPSTVDAEVAAGKKAGDLYMCNMASVVEYQIYSSDVSLQSEKVVSVEFEALQGGIAGEFSCNISDVDFEAYKTPSLTENKVVTTVKSPMCVGTREAKAKVYMVVGTGAQTGTVTVNTDVASYTFSMEKEVLFERAMVKPLGLNLANAANRKSHGITCEWYYGGEGKLNAPSAIHPAVDVFGNVYVTETNSPYLHKINSEGSLDWKTKMGSVSGQLSSPSVEPDGSVVYAGGGSSSGAAVYAYYTADGSQKWEFASSEFWNGANTPAPKINRISPAIGQNCIYVGNGGSTGTAIAINKETGDRASYVCSKADGTGGPAGGTNVGMSVSKGGAVLFGANYGIFSADAGLMDNPTLTGNQGGYVPFAAQYRDGNRSASFNSNVACFTLNGIGHYAYLHGTKNGMNVNWGPISTGMGLKSYYTGNNSQNWTTHQIAGTAAQDQGGVVIGLRNEIIVALKNNTTVSGGLYAIDPATNQKAWSFAAGDDVAGVPAVDDAGNVHFFTDKTATYYIVKPDYENKTATLLASAKILDVVLAKGDSQELDSTSAARTWTSAVIGVDGKIYAYAQLGGKGYVVCMSYEGCKGIGDTPWPMKAADCFNSGHQLK